MFDFLSNKFSSLFSRFNGQSKLTDANIKETLEGIKDALLQADVPYDVVQSFADSVAKEVVGAKLASNLKPAEYLAKVMNDRLIEFMGGKQITEFSFQLPSVVLIMGLQGSGKTTTVAKMAYQVNQQASKRGKKRRILVASVDYYRPAAIDQLEIACSASGATFYRAKATNPVLAAQEIYEQYKQGQYELLFLDTAGRLHIDNQMLEELRAIDARLQPRYKLLVLDSMTGQESLNVAKAFDQAIGFQAAILTKMDSDTRGGAAFSFRYALKKPIIFVGTGEKLEDLQSFYPERAASRMLGMGDMATLIERAQEKIKQSEQESIEKSFMAGRLTLEDFAQQMNMMSKLGNLTQLIKYIPGMNTAQISNEELERSEKEMKRFRAIIDSMTPKERKDHKLLDGSRKMRVACGAGATVTEINLLLERFEQAQQYVKLFKKSGLWNKIR